MDQEGRNM